jgi:transcriptional regulator with PAS, ATPase and Fis domain
MASDAGSKNGTRINGRLFERGEVHDGDVVECGNTFLVVRRDVPTAADPRGTLGISTLSAAVERELAPLAKIARSRVCVLVRGETGTGKDVLAHAVHHHSRRAGPLVTVNCAAIPPALLESEIFGSRRGAFSGAEDRVGLATSADRGTLFLDEIGELSVASQAAMLRFLQNGEVRALGASRTNTVDVRVIAATNRTVEQLVADGAFRRDLYARLRGFEVRLPALSDRREDLGFLVAELLRRHGTSARPYTLSRAAARALFLHPWPFNVRELEQAIGTAVNLATGSEIKLADLRLEAPAASPPPPPTSRDRLLLLVEEHRGNVSAIARALATSRSQVHRLLVRESIDPAKLKS